MLRADDSPDAAHAYLHVHPDGRVIAAWRAHKGGTTQQRCLGIIGFPAAIGMSRSGDAVNALYATPDGTWHAEPFAKVDDLARGGRVGLAVCSHAADILAEASVQLIEDPAIASSKLKTQSHVKRNLLQAPATAGPTDVNSTVATAHWPGWGTAFEQATTEAGEPAANSFVYQHSRASEQGNDGVYRDVPGVQAGTRVMFELPVEVVAPSTGGHLPRGVELRLESEMHGERIHIASAAWACEHMATTGPNRLQVTGTAPADNLRVLIQVAPNKDTPREGALRIGPALLVID